MAAPTQNEKVTEANAGEATLKAVPHPNRAAKLESYDDGVLVTVPLRKRWWLRPPLTWMFPVSRERRVHLDATGAWVLSQCDGRRPIEAVIEAVMKKYKLSFQEARASVLAFMRMLTERGVVAVVPAKQKK